MTSLASFLYQIQNVGYGIFATSPQSTLDFLDQFTKSRPYNNNMTDQNFHTTKEDLRKSESQISKANDGNVPTDSEPSLMKVSLQPLPMQSSFTLEALLTMRSQSVIDSTSKSKHELIDERQANLPLPEQPPVASDWNSADASKVNVGSGGVQSDISYGNGSESGLRGPATGGSSVRTDGAQSGSNTAPIGGVGRQGHDGLDSLPKDATKS